MTSLLLYPLLCAAFYYLGSRALITKWLWTRYPTALDRFMLCAACTGFWYGVVVAGVGGHFLELDFAGLPGDQWYTPVIVGLCASVWTPPLAFLHIGALDALAAPAETQGVTVPRNGEVPAPVTPLPRCGHSLDQGNGVTIRCKWEQGHGGLHNYFREGPHA